MFGDRTRAARQGKIAALSNEEAAQLAFELPPDDVLLVAVKMLRSALERRENPRFEIANQNAVLLAHYLIARLACLSVVVMESTAEGGR